MITDYINLFLYKHLLFYSYLVRYAWPLSEIAFIFVWILVIKYKKVSGRKTGLFAFILLGIMMVCNIFGLDILAGAIGEYVFILLVIAFIQEFYHFLKYEKE